MPNDLPYMPTFIGDFLVAVQAWPSQRVGAYWLALCYQWEHGGIPATNEKELARILHESRPVARRLWGAIAPKFDARADGRYWNRRLERVRDEVRRTLANRRARAQKAAAGRWAPTDAQASTPKKFSTGFPQAERMLGQCNPNPKSTYTPPTPPRGGRSKPSSRRRRRADAPPAADVEHVQRSQEVQRLMHVEGLSRAVAMRKAGYS